MAAGVAGKEEQRSHPLPGPLLSFPPLNSHIPCTDTGIHVSTGTRGGVKS